MNADAGHQNVTAGREKKASAIADGQDDVADLLLRLDVAGR